VSQQRNVVNLRRFCQLLCEELYSYTPSANNLGIRIFRFSLFSLSTYSSEMAAWF